MQGRFVALLVVGGAIPIYLRWTPHPVIVTIRDNKDCIRILLYSYKTTNTGRGVLLKCTTQKGFHIRSTMQIGTGSAPRSQRTRQVSPIYTQTLDTISPKPYRSNGRTRDYDSEFCELHMFHPRLPSPKFILF